MDKSEFKLEDRQWVLDHINLIVSNYSGSETIKKHPGDREIALALCEKDGRLLPPEFHGDRDFVLEILQNRINQGDKSGDRMAYYLDDSLKDDEEIAYYISLCSGTGIEHMSERIHNCPKIMRQAILSNSENAHYIGEELASSMEFVCDVMTFYPEILFHVKGALTDSDEIFQLLVSFLKNGKFQYGRFNHFSERILGDKEYTSIMMSFDSYNYKYFTEEMRMNYEYAKAFLENDGSPKCVPEKLLLEHLELACIAVNASYSSYGALPESLKNNIVVVLSALNTDVPHTFSWYIPGGWGNDHYVSCIRDIVPEIRSNKDLQRYLIEAYEKTSYCTDDEKQQLAEHPETIFQVLTDLGNSVWYYEDKRDENDPIEKLDLTEAIRIEFDKYYR